MLVFKHVVHNLEVIIVLVSMKTDCRMIPITSSEPERLANIVVIRVEEFARKADDPEVLTFRLIPGQVFDSSFAIGTFNSISKHLVVPVNDLLRVCRSRSDTF